MNELVIDTNILLTFFWKNSFTKNLIKKIKVNLISPEYALEEIKDKKEDILKKCKISNEEFEKLRIEIATFVTFISLEEYRSSIKKVLILPDPKDIDFLALALKLNAPIWSNDKKLKDQSLVPILSTPEIINIMSFSE